MMRREVAILWEIQEVTRRREVLFLLRFMFVMKRVDTSVFGRIPL